MAAAQLLDDAFWAALAADLGKLPPVTAERRSESWKTAEDLLPLAASRGISGLSSTELDAALLRAWESGALARWRIRPAKYPCPHSVCRLWGHEDVVGARPAEVIEQRRRDPAYLLPAPSSPAPLAASAPVIFVSHALFDQAFASRVKGALHARGIRAWLAEEEIQQGEPIFERVRSALQTVRGMLVLVTRTSIASAWVYTEAVQRVSVIPERAQLVFDGSDPMMMALLKSAKPDERGSYITSMDPNALKALEKSYRRRWKRTARFQSTLDRGARTGAGWVQRPEKFRSSAELFLVQLHLTRLAILTAEGVLPPPPYRTFDAALADVLA